MYKDENAKQYDVSFRELQQWGFIPLTGEADSIGIRLLVDLTPQAVSLISDFMGGMTPTRENYNQSNGQVKSIFLPKSAEFLAALITFCILSEDNSRVVLVMHDKISPHAREFIVSYPVEEWDNPKVRKEWDNFNYRIYRLSSSQLRRSLSNVHGFTGRSQ